MSATKKPALQLDHLMRRDTGDDALDFLVGATPSPEPATEAKPTPAKRATPPRAAKAPALAQTTRMLNGEADASTTPQPPDTGRVLLLPVGQIAPDHAQLRRLPLPAELEARAKQGDVAATSVLTSLRQLGESLRANGQVQPVIVYADSDPNDPAIQYRLLNGQRRWSAAILAGLPTLEAIAVTRPTETQRLLQQFEENERREDFSDMERCWAIMSIKQALEAEAGKTVPWSAVEERLHLSTQRRQDLLRLLRFPPEAQSLISRYGWSEWTLRPIHMAINAGIIDQETALKLLETLSRANPVNLSLVEDLLNGRGGSKPSDEDEEAPDTIIISRAAIPPRFTVPIKVARDVRRMEESIVRLYRSMPARLDPTQRGEWRGTIEHLRDALQSLLDALGDEDSKK